jgi:hypothetical protein
VTPSAIKPQILFKVKGFLALVNELPHIELKLRKSVEVFWPQPVQLCDKMGIYLAMTEQKQTST